MKSKLSYNQARECVYRVYEKRGYIGATELIELINNFISLQDRSNLQDMIIELENINENK